MVTHQSFVEGTVVVDCAIIFIRQGITWFVSFPLLFSTFSLLSPANFVISQLWKSDDQGEVEDTEEARDWARPSGWATPVYLPAPWLIFIMIIYKHTMSFIFFFLNVDWTYSSRLFVCCYLFLAIVGKEREEKLSKENCGGRGGIRKGLSVIGVAGFSSNLVFVWEQKYSIKVVVHFFYFHWRTVTL